MKVMNAIVQHMLNTHLVDAAFSSTIVRTEDGIVHRDYTRSKTSHMAVRAMSIAREIFRDDKRTRCFFAKVSRANRP